MKSLAAERMWTGLVHAFGAFRVYVGVVLLAGVGFVGRATYDSPHNWAAYAAVGAIFAAWSVGLMWCARWVWRREGYVTLRAIGAGVLGYHALFGVVMMLTHVATTATSNDDIALRLWPHVVHFIDSFE